MKALLWDVDGTIAETERDGHRVAFNRAFEIHGLSWQWNEALYGELLDVTGGQERLLFYMASRDDVPVNPDERRVLARALHRTKNEAYAERVRDGQVAWRAGVRELMEQCRGRNLPMAIATTTSRANVEALLRRGLGRGWNDWFRAVACGEDVQRKKPDPEVYERVLDALAIAPSEAVALEDSPQGAAAARAAGVPVVVTRSVYFPAADIAGALAAGPGLERRDGWQPQLPLSADALVGLDDIAAWHRAAGAHESRGRGLSVI